MSKQILKRLVVGGAFLLATASALGAQQAKESHQVVQEKKVFAAKRDPFVPPKNLNYLSGQPERTIDSLDELAKRLEQDGFDRKKVMAGYDDERFRIHPKIYRYFKDNPEKTPYPEYRRQVGLDKKINDAPSFFKNYATHLFRSEDIHRVEAPTILAIMGVESDFGLNPGKLMAFNAAVSLYITPKKEFGYAQLRALFDIEKTKKIDIMKVLSSYAVCSFPGQFLLENIPVYFVGMNNKPYDDLFLFENWFYAVGNYVHKKGWDEKQNYHSPAKGSANWQVLLLYNDSDNYVRAVVELADSLKNNPGIRILIQEHEELKKSGRTALKW